jgi:hypothetical protein
LLAQLVQNKDWAQDDEDIVKVGDVEISVVIWALKIGPRGLAAGWKDGKSMLDILMDTEEVWVLNNIAESEYEGKKQILEDFADDLCEWGMELQHAGATEVTRL